MLRATTLLAACAALLALAALAAASEGSPSPPCLPPAAAPTYALLQPVPGGNLRSAPAQPYAYGWFGASPRHCRKTVHYGYYNAYKQWSFR